MCMLIFKLTHGRKVHREAVDWARMKEEIGLIQGSKILGKGNSVTVCQLDTGRDTGKNLKRQEPQGEGRGEGGTFPTRPESPLRNMKEHALLSPRRFIATLAP